MEYISIVYCRLGVGETDDCISVAMFFIDKDDNVEMFVSNRKMTLLKKIMIKKQLAYQLFVSTVQGLLDYTNIQNKSNFKFIQNQQIHSNGLIKMSSPTAIDTCHIEDRENFAQRYFEKFIDVKY